MKKILFLALTIAVTKTTFSQGFVAQGTNSLIGVNSSYSVQPLTVGIGTNYPSAALHVNGSLRFEGLPNVLNNRILAADASGNVSWRDVSSLNTSDPTAWNILGNANINDAANFLGTTNNQAVNFRVGNAKRVSISRWIQPAGFTSNLSAMEVGVSGDNTNLTNFRVWSKDVVGLSVPTFFSSDITGMSFNNLPGNNNTLGRVDQI